MLTLVKLIALCSLITGAGKATDTRATLPDEWIERTDETYLKHEPETVSPGNAFVVVVDGQRTIVPISALHEEKWSPKGVPEMEYICAFNRSASALAADKPDARRPPTGGSRQPRSQERSRLARRIEADRRLARQQHERMLKKLSGRDGLSKDRAPEDRVAGELLRVGGYIGFKGIYAVPHVLCDSELFRGTGMTFFADGRIETEGGKFVARETLRVGAGEYSLVYLTPVDVDRRFFLSAVVYDMEQQRFRRYELVKSSRSAKSGVPSSRPVKRIVFVDGQTWVPLERYRQAKQEIEVRPGVFRTLLQNSKERLRPVVEEIGPYGFVRLRYVDISAIKGMRTNSTPPDANTVYSFASGAVARIEYEDGSYVFDRERRIFRHDISSPAPVTEAFLAGLDAEAKDRLIQYAGTNSTQWQLSAGGSTEPTRASWDTLPNDEKVIAVVRARRNNVRIGTAEERRAVADRREHERRQRESHERRSGELHVKNGTADVVEFELHGMLNHEGREMQLYQRKDNFFLRWLGYIDVVAQSASGSETMRYPVEPGSNRWKIEPGATFIPSFAGKPIICSEVKYTATVQGHAETYHVEKPQGKKDFVVTITRPKRSGDSQTDGR